jgi:D-glycero-D-manno-heptose 1,7-bisphosphate phosphatase
MSQTPTRALFLDRDGVINREIGYLHRAEDVVFVDGIFSLCRTAMALGYRIIVVTNQAGIARGYYSVAQFDGLMDWMRMQLRKEYVELDAVYYCPYHPEHGIGEYRRDHIDRKPAPGMLLRGAAEFGIDLAHSVMIGDRCSDIAAAHNAGLRQAFLIAGTEDAPCAGNYLPIETLSEAELWLTRQG